MEIKQHGMALRVLSTTYTYYYYYEHIFLKQDTEDTFVVIVFHRIELCPCVFWMERNHYSSDEEHFNEFVNTDLNNKGISKIEEYFF